MSNSFHEQVSAVTPLGGALDGSRRPAERRPRKSAAKPEPVKLASFCRRCGFRDEDPQVMHRHMTKEIAELTELLEQVTADAGSLSRMVSLKEAAELSGLHVQTVRRLCKEGVLVTAVQWQGVWLLERDEAGAYEPRSGGVAPGAKWTPATVEEIDFLRDNQDMSGTDLAELLGRSHDWVRDRRIRMRKLEGEEIWPKKRFGRASGESLKHRGQVAH